MGEDILHRVGNGGHCVCETVSREVLLQVEIPEKWTQEPPCFAITIWCAIKIAHQSLQKGHISYATTTRQFAQRLIRAKNEATMKALYYWPFVKESNGDVTGGFSSQRANNVQSFHVVTSSCMFMFPTLRLPPTRDLVTDTPVVSRLSCNPYLHCYHW